MLFFSLFFRASLFLFSKINIQKIAMFEIFVSTNIFFSK